MRHLLSILVLLCSTSATAVPRLVLIGDSLTSPAPCCDEWGLTLEWMMPDWEVVNDGLGGTTLQQWDANFSSWGAPEMPADVAVIELGSNDAAQGLPVATYRVLIRYLITLAQTAGAAEILLMAPPDHPAYYQAPARNLILGYRDEVASACADLEGVDCGPDLFTLFDETNFNGDGIHYNQSGHDLLAGTIEPQIRAVPEPAVRESLAAGVLCLAAIWCWRERPRA